MSQITGTNSTSSSSTNTNSTQGNDFRSVDLDQFLQLMITELQNQDPLNPTDNNEMLAQLTQIRQMGATNQLSDTLTNFAISQELTMGSSLIGKTVVALDDEAKEINGVVEKVSVQIDEKDRTKRSVKVHVGGSTVDIKNVREINREATEETEAA